MPGSEAQRTLPLDIRTAKPSSVRAVNRSIMLELIRQHQPVSRADLARLTGVFRSSVSDIVDELIERSLVTEERDALPGRRGRTPTGLRLNDESYPVLGLNIRPQYSQLAYAGLSGKIEHSLRFETPGSPKHLVRVLTKAIREMRNKLGWTARMSFRCLGLAIPGHVDAPNGRILWVPTHTELNGFPITSSVETETGIPALADNDCNLGALSELWLTTARKKDRGSDFVFLNVSDFGTGTGLVINGEIYRGHDGASPGSLVTWWWNRKARFVDVAGRVAGNGTSVMRRRCGAFTPEPNSVPKTFKICWNARGEVKHPSYVASTKQRIILRWAWRISDSHLIPLRLCLRAELPRHGI